MKSFSRMAGVLMAVCMLAVNFAAAMDLAEEPEVAPPGAPATPEPQAKEELEKELNALEHRRVQHMEKQGIDLIERAKKMRGAEITPEEAMEQERRGLELLGAAKRLRLEAARRPRPPAQVVHMPVPAPTGLANVLVVQAERMEPSNLREVVEDMTVMSRILDKALRRELGNEAFYPERSTFVPLFDGDRRRSIYLHGYGALFIMSVKFPLVGPATEVEPKPEGEEADSLWEQTRREVQGPPRPPHMPVLGQAFVLAAGPTPPRGLHYNAARVEELKTALLEALRHASNIRALQMDESVAVAVLGSAGPGKLAVGKGLETFFGQPGPGGSSFGGGSGGLGRAPTRRSIVVSVPTTAVETTVLTVHVKKADVDAFAKGELSLDEFRERATILIYSPGPAEPVSSAQGMAARIRR